MLAENMEADNPLITAVWEKYFVCIQTHNSKQLQN